MRLALLLSAAMLIMPSAALARPHHTYAHHHGYRPTGYGDDYYTAVSGHRVHRPEHANGRPGGATARCRDHSWSFSENHRGTCSHHGGVASWL